VIHWRNALSKGHSLRIWLVDEEKTGEMAKPELIELDALSHRLIAELQRDGRASFREIGKRLKVSPGTVRARYNQLRKAGILEVIAVPNPWRMGLDFHATVGLRLEPGSIEDAVAVLARKREVGWIGLLLTGYDVMFEVAMRDSHGFGEYKESLWKEIPGFVNAEIFAMWDVRKFRYEIGLEAEPVAAKKTGSRRRPDRRPAKGAGRESSRELTSKKRAS
jgi:Lrp/AsnC family transcriptional regulator for asnA, asnC and gidA